MKRRNVNDILNIIRFFAFLFTAIIIFAGSSWFNSLFSYQIPWLGEFHNLIVINSESFFTALSISFVVYFGISLYMLLVKNKIDNDSFKDFKEGQKSKITEIDGKCSAIEENISHAKNELNSVKEKSQNMVDMQNIKLRSSLREIIVDCRSVITAYIPTNKQIHRIVSKINLPALDNIKELINEYEQTRRK